MGVKTTLVGAVGWGPVGVAMAVGNCSSGVVSKFDPFWPPQKEDFTMIIGFEIVYLILG